MVISHQRKYVFIAVPKTASTSVHELLVTECDGISVGPRHCSIIPEECREYFLFCVVRNPYTRYLSLYDHISYHRSHRCHELAYSLSFSQFARWMSNPELEPIIEHSPEERSGGPCGSPGSDPFRGRDLCQAIFLAHLLPRIRCLRYENLASELTQLSFVNKQASGLPWLNRSVKDRHHLLDEESRQYIYEWAKDDFETFGYSKTF